MERLIAYLLQSVLVSGILTTYYWVALRNRKLHGFNRWYLLGVLVLSALLPLVRIGWSPAIAQPVLGGTVERVENVSRAANNGFPWITLGLWGIMAVSGVLLLVSLRRVAQLYRLKSRQSVCRMGGYTLIETDDPRAPFSFLNNLFWRRGVDPDDPVNNKILHHELAHIDGRHSWDGLFAQGLCCICWINPFFWIVRRELSLVHEFIADAATGMEGDAGGFARMLLQSMNEGRFLEPAQAFFQSPIKRRLIMMSNNRVSRFCAVRKTLVVPVVLAVAALVSCSKEAGPQVAVKSEPVKLEIATTPLQLKMAQEKKLMLVWVSNGQSSGKRLMRLAVSGRAGSNPTVEEKRAAETPLIFYAQPGENPTIEQKREAERIQLKFEAERATAPVGKN